jgi:Tubulin domain
MNSPLSFGEPDNCCRRRLWRFGLRPRARDGTVDEIRHERIPDIAYQNQLDEEVEEDPAEAPPDPKESVVVPPLGASDVRYWSDYNRVYYLPRSMHKLPDLADWEAEEGDWHGGKETFLRYNMVRLRQHVRRGA